MSRRKFRMPHLSLVIAGRNIWNDRVAVSSGKCCPRAFRHEGVGDHMIVNVTAKRCDARVVEGNGWRFFPTRQRDLELLDSREGIDLVRGLIVVGKDYMPALGHDRHQGQECLIALIDSLLAKEMR